MAKKPVGGAALQKLADKGGALVNEGCVDLHEIGAEAEFFLGFGFVGNPADPDDGNFPGKGGCKRSEDVVRFFENGFPREAARFVRP